MNTSEILAEELAMRPGEVQSLAVEPAVEIAPNGEERRVARTDALLLTVKPQAPVQVVMSGHNDPVYPTDTHFQEDVRRDDGALNRAAERLERAKCSRFVSSIEASNMR